MRTGDYADGRLCEWADEVVEANWRDTMHVGDVRKNMDLGMEA